MKLPYRRGDSFAMPLGNGQFTDSCIVACEHRVVVVAIIVDGDRPFVLRVSDDALVAHRWKRTGQCAPDESLRAERAYWMPAAKAERLAAAAVGAPHPAERHVRVREMLDSNARDVLARVDEATIVALTEPLNDRSLHALVATVHDHPGVHVRLHGGALEHLAALAVAPLTRLTLSKPTTAPLALSPHVEELAVVGPVDCAQLAAAFPALRRLSIDANGADVDLAPLQALARLRILDLSAANVIDASEFHAFAQLEALRLSRVTGIADAKVLAALSPRVLALEHLHELRRLESLAALSSLEQLELLGLWQFEIADVEWALDLPTLVRCEIDIGGRRKNVELYKRAGWAYPWPFPAALSPR